MAHTEALRPAPALAGNGPQNSDQLGGVIGQETIANNAASQDAVYSASPIKRFRRTKSAVTSIRDAIRDVLEADNPQTVRQVFYALTVRGLIKKAEIEYQQTVIRLLVAMREAGEIPFNWIADNTRWMRKPTTYVGLDVCLNATANFYRHDLWAAMPVYVELWCEKDALAGVLIEETEPYDVPLMVARGYASISFLHSAAEAIKAKGKPSYIYHFGDLDPSGVDAARDIEAKLRRYAPGAEIHFERPAVTRAQVEEWNLPSRPTKMTDTRAKKFAGTSVELDAIPASKLRELVRNCSERHVDKEQLAVLRAAEESERETLGRWAKILNGGGR
jgi:hypothetical protein